MNDSCCIIPAAYEPNIRGGRIKAIASHLKSSTASYPKPPQVDTYADGPMVMTMAVAVARNIPVFGGHHKTRVHMICRRRHDVVLRNKPVDSTPNSTGGNP